MWAATLSTPPANPELRTSHVFVQVRFDANQAQEKAALEKIKKIEGMPFFCPNREEVILANATTNTKGLEKEYIQDIYQTLIEATRKVADQKFSN